MERRRRHMHSSDLRVWYSERCPSQSCCPEGSTKGSTKDRRIAADSFIVLPDSQVAVVAVPVCWIADHEAHIIPVYQTRLVTRLDPGISLRGHQVYTVYASALYVLPRGLKRCLNHCNQNDCPCRVAFASVTLVDSFIEVRLVTPVRTNN